MVTQPAVGQSLQKLLSWVRMVFPLWLPHGSWSGGWTSRTNAWSAVCPFQCKGRQMNQINSKHRFNSNKLGLFCKICEGDFHYRYFWQRGKAGCAPQSCKVCYCNFAFLTLSPACWSLANHGGVLYWPLSVTLKIAITVQIISEFPLVLLCQWHKFVVE